MGERLRALQENSVTHAWFDRSGALVDPWRSRLVIVLETRGGRTTATATSAGPDRRAGTWDDVVRVRAHDSSE